MDFGAFYDWLAGLPVFLQIPLGLAVFIGLQAAAPFIWLAAYTAVRIYAAGLALPFIAAWRRLTRRSRSQGPEH